MGYVRGSLQGRAGSSNDRPAAESEHAVDTWQADRGARAPTTPPRQADTWSRHNSWGRDWSDWSRWNDREQEGGTWSRQQWGEGDTGAWQAYPTQRPPELEPPWANWGGVNGNVWPWGEQLYRTSKYTWMLKSERPSEAIGRLKRELGCFFVEAWHAYLAHHKAPSKDPKLSSENFCDSFLTLVQENDYDVRVALKRARIYVDWYKAADKLNLSTNAGPRYPQRGGGSAWR